MARHYQQKLYTPIHPEKYEGNPTNIFMRSSWETKFANWCDHNPSVLKWSSEETVIRYICDTDNRPHLYYVDFKIKVKTGSGMKTYLVEIKPFNQTHPPKVPEKKTKRFINEMMVWGKNSSKWRYAREYCSLRGMEFIILDEYALGLAKRPKQ